MYQMERSSGDTLLTQLKSMYQHRERGIIGEGRQRKYAVLVPLVVEPDGTYSLLFEKRASTLRSQAGEICFPGGQCEEGDVTEWETARRETAEELNLSKEGIRYVGDLDLLVTPSQLIIYPFVGVIQHSQEIDPNPDEVEKVIRVPLKRLAEMIPVVHESSIQIKTGEGFPFHLIPQGKNYPWRVGNVQHAFYQVDDIVIWGLTARILQHFLDGVREVLALHP